MNLQTTTKNADGKSRTLVYNETIMLINSSDEISILLEELGWDINFIFKDTSTSSILDELNSTYSADVIIENKKIIITLNGWNSTTWIQKKQPDVIHSTDRKNTIIMTYKTKMNKKYNWRTFSISIWLERN